MDTSVSPEFPTDLPVTQVVRPARSWTCPWHISVPITALYFAAVIAGMHFVVRPMAARYATLPAPASTSCDR